MFHIFHGTLSQQWPYTYLSNELFGINVSYSGRQTTGTYHIYPHLDDNNKTIKYFAFDTVAQKQIFEELLKISGIGPKTAFHIAQVDQTALSTAVEALDVKFFQNIPGIGPKTAKKILLELKDTVKQDDFQKLAIDDKLYKKIASAMKSLGYESAKVKAALANYHEPITEKDIQKVVQWLMKNI